LGPFSESPTCSFGTICFEVATVPRCWLSVLVVVVMPWFSFDAEAMDAFLVTAEVADDAAAFIVALAGVDAGVEA
jgi:hypothetical protein